MSGEANPKFPDSFGRIRWRGNKPQERQTPNTNAARRENATTSALQDTGVADFVNGIYETLESLRRIPRSWLASSSLLKCVVERPQGSQKNEEGESNQNDSRLRILSTKIRSSAREVYSNFGR